MSTIFRKRQTNISVDKILIIMRLFFTLIAFGLLSFQTAEKNDSRLIGHAWTLRTICDSKINYHYNLTNITIQLVFQDLTFGGTTGCNAYGGKYKTTKNKIKFSKLSKSVSPCDKQIEEVESFLGKNLGDMYFDIQSDTLVLSDKKGVMLKYSMNK